ncbi:MAG: hypothetical protein G01um1014106_575 [Parcubacteria group bacterium Gr01-1014_106]|nr:MAG: hypothetical protein G01um1014106_575 [Parcubacteria group bacterium Gr01-1014_106]
MHIILMVALVLSLSRVALADHVPFLDGKTRHTGGSCCGHGNCVSMSVSYGKHAGEVIVNGVSITLDPGNIHPTPDPTGKGWYCFSMDSQCVSADGTLRIISGCAMCVFPQRPQGES